MARRCGRVDKNQARIVSTVRQMGASVYSLADVGNGVPDVLVGIFGISEVWEIKSETGKLTEDQVRFHNEFKGSVRIIRSSADAIRRIQELGQMGRGRGA